MEPLFHIQFFLCHFFAETSLGYLGTSPGPLGKTLDSWNGPLLRSGDHFNGSWGCTWGFSKKIYIKKIEYEKVVPNLRESSCKKVFRFPEGVAN